MNVEDYNHHAAEEDRARRESPLRDHLKDVLAKTVKEVEEEAGEPDPPKDRSRYTVHVPDPVDEMLDRLAWSKTKVCLPCPDVFEAAMRRVLTVLADPETALTPQKRADAFARIMRQYAVMFAAALKAFGK